MPQPCARRAHRHPPTEQHSTIVGSTFPILYIPMHFSICVFVFSDMTPQNIIVDIPLLSYYLKDSMCLEI